MSTTPKGYPRESSACINWHAERKERNLCTSMPRAGAQAKYEALRQGVPSDLQLDDFDWSQKKRLGSGSFGSVSSVPLVDSGVRVAVKKDKRASTYNTEVAVLEYISGDEPMTYAAELLGEFHHTLASGEIEMYSVQPIYKKSLAATIYPYGCDRLGKPLDSTTMYKMIVQLVLVLFNLHREEIIHRDLKLDNVMLDDEDDVCVIDFGLAYLKARDNADDTSKGIPTQHHYMGTECNMAPEMLNEKGYDGKVDVWALGVMIYELGCGKHPFWDHVNGFHEERAKDYELEIPEDARQRYGDEWVDFVHVLLSKQPQDRPAANELCRFKYFENISEQMWQALTEPYANTEYLLGIQLPENEIRVEAPKNDACLFSGREEWTSQPSSSFIAALEVTPKPAYVPHFATSTSQTRSSTSSLEYFTPPQSPILDEDDNDASSEEPTPDPSPLFTPADTGSECDPFDVALDQDVLDLDAVSQALQETAKEGEMMRRQHGFGVVYGLGVSQ